MTACISPWRFDARFAIVHWNAAHPPSKSAKSALTLLKDSGGGGGGGVRPLPGPVCRGSAEKAEDGGGPPQRFLRGVQ